MRSCALTIWLLSSVALASLYGCSAQHVGAAGILVAGPVAAAQDRALIEHLEETWGLADHEAQEARRAFESGDWRRSQAYCVASLLLYQQASVTLGARGVTIESGTLRGHHFSDQAVANREVVNALANALGRSSARSYLQLADAYEAEGALAEALDIHQRFPEIAPHADAAMLTRVAAAAARLEGAGGGGGRSIAVQPPSAAPTDGGSPLDADLRRALQAIIDQAAKPAEKPIWLNPAWIEVVRSVSEGADPNLRLPDGRTAVHLAAPFGSGEVLQFLIHAGADPVRPSTIWAAQCSRTGAERATGSSAAGNGTCCAPTAPCWRPALTRFTAPWFTATARPSAT